MQNLIDDSFFLQIDEVGQQPDFYISVLILNSIYEQAHVVLNSLKDRTHGFGDTIKTARRELALSINNGHLYLLETDLSKAKTCISVGIDAARLLFQTIRLIIFGNESTCYIN